MAGEPQINIFFRGKPQINIELLFKVLVGVSLVAICLDCGGGVVQNKSLTALCAPFIVYVNVDAPNARWASVAGMW